MEIHQMILLLKNGLDKHKVFIQVGYKEPILFQDPHSDNMNNPTLNSINQ